MLRLEQMDPVHRSNYEDHNDGGCGRAFQLWAADSRQDKPFFMWLEESLVCVADDKAEAAAQSVPYDRMDQKQGTPGNQEKVVLLPAPLMTVDLHQPQTAVALCSTSSYSCVPLKDPTHSGGAGVAAFAWSEEGELFIGEHRGHVFHHSSFVSGRRVKCSGMIRIDNGLVTALSNNSGHYKPRVSHMVNFVRWLKQAGAFSPTAKLEVFLGSNQTFNGNPAAFLTAHG